MILITIILHPDVIDEIKIWETESGIQLRFETQSGDKCFLELDNEMLGYVIKQLIHYAWNMTLEEAFNSSKKKRKPIDLKTSDSSDISF